MKITDFINADTIEKMKEEINGANGNEVFFRGIPDEAGIVSEMEVIDLALRSEGNVLGAAQSGRASDLYSDRKSVV